MLDNIKLFVFDLGANLMEYKGMHLVDGGLQNNIPADIPRFFDCDYVVAVDVNATRGGGTESLKLMDILKSTIGIMNKSNSIRGYIDSDIIIKPSMAKYKSTKLDEIDEMIAEGYRAGLDCVQRVLELISRKPKRIIKKKNKLIQSKKPLII